ncbi:hypothetical protein EDD27_1056 [Nonomuraea polychroma]|uniref:DUF711 family protein n=1 Tax=Nonomuraea polychroma TaxID=46176 RepID=A0A438LZ18_9ACTN|nr:DUF711 family protein [Nonomuraea polychroma]RVX38732.1 hypothetical protein EDD27_1056 [Nonomuraea polychroma]
MAQSVIRTITVGISEAHPVAGAVLEKAAAAAHWLESGFSDAGYEVQTIRLSTRPVFDDMTGDLLPYARSVQRVLNDTGIGHLSLGPAQAARPEFPLERLAGIEELLAECTALNCTVQLGTAQHGLRAAAALPAARIVTRLAAGTPQGIGNFRFAALANVGPGHPFFPAAYQEGPDGFAVGLQSAGVVTDALSDAPSGLDPEAITERVRAALAAAAEPVARLAERLAADIGLGFHGIDLSPAPHGDVSIGAAIEHAIGGPFGGPGTLAAASALTRALRSIELPRCGYCGLMLPVMEDTVLARAWESGGITVHQLLAYSAVCGTGLDTVPLPGDVSEAHVAGLLLDVAALAVRLDKPLSARLFPVPGAGPGDRTAFGSPYLVDLTLPR